jgi:predicted RNA methylase
MPHGGIAVDVSANVGFFAYALAGIADRVFAFEPNPDYACFARWMLRLIGDLEPSGLPLQS